MFGHLYVRIDLYMTIMYNAERKLVAERRKI